MRSSCEGTAQFIVAWQCRRDPCSALYMPPPLFGVALRILLFCFSLINYLSLSPCSSLFNLLESIQTLHMWVYKLQNRCTRLSDLFVFSPTVMTVIKYMFYTATLSHQTYVLRAHGSGLCMSAKSLILTNLLKQRYLKKLRSPFL